ncbi:MAG: LPS assembly lipoprotein LptE [Halieaceae bacterium]|jgi:LPS-assembly lipoprotein|nr:LPS assembly lipoprotein LptE [Halieaceae bacterium]
MQRRLASYTLILGMSCLLAACGFQLRGTGGGGAALPDAWKTMRLATGNPNSEFSQAVRNLFAADGIVWVAQGDPGYTLVLGPERFNQTNLSLNNEARVSQYELTMLATFSVRGSDGAQVMPDTVASVTRQMENDPRNAMGKGEEIRILKSEMRTELAQQIIRRIGFFATRSP